MERDMRSGRIDQKAAAIPKVLSTFLKLEHKELDGRKVWILQPKTNGSNEVILYLHGGAYIHNIFKQHWHLLAKLIKKTRATFVVPDYPLAPQFNCTQTLSFVHRVYQSLLDQYPASHISFAGDSAGAGLALALAQNLRDDGLALPKQLILLSPWLDVSMSNSEIHRVDKHDKLLGIKGLQLAGKAYAGDLDIKDPRVSPIYGKFHQLPRISIFIGTHDLFIPDCRKLTRLLEEAETPCHFYEYPRMMHVWPIMPALKEAQHSINQLADLIQS